MQEHMHQEERKKMNSTTRHVNARTWDTGLDIVEGKRGVGRPLGSFDRPIMVSKKVSRETCLAQVSEQLWTSTIAEYDPLSTLETLNVLNRGTQGGRKSVDYLKT